MSTFTVPSTQVYQDAATGDRRRYHEGDVVDIATAVRFGMPGAALPADGAPFTDAQVTYLAAEFEPEGNFAATDHEHDAAYAAIAHTHDATYPNLITNGEFETDITGWDDAASDAVLSRETTGGQLFGVGSLKIVAFEPLAGFAAKFPAAASPAIDVVAGEIIAWGFVATGDGAIAVSFNYGTTDAVSADLVNQLAGIAGGDPLAYSGITVVPAASTKMRFGILSDYSNVAPADNLIVDSVYAFVVGAMT